MATLTITRGDRERLSAVITPFSAAAGLRFMAKKKLRDADEDAVIDKTIGEGIVVTVAGDEDTPAEAQITIDPEDTQLLPNKSTPAVKLLYDLVDGDDHTLDTGEIIVLPEVLTGA
jgi:hypothetical protein